MKRTPPMEIVTMPDWKARILKSVAWILGYRNEHAYVITINIDLDKLKAEKVNPKSDINRLLAEQEYFEE